MVHLLKSRGGFRQGARGQTLAPPFCLYRWHISFPDFYVKLIYGFILVINDMITTVFRVQNKDGFGAYNDACPSNWSKDKMTSTQDRPFSGDDLRPMDTVPFTEICIQENPSILSLHSYNAESVRKCVIHGFKDMKSLYEWFTPEDLKELRAEGYNVVFYEVESELTHDLGHQILFYEPSRHPKLINTPTVREEFFQNVGCSFFPCKPTEKLNCIFCFCPLYRLDCGGDYKILGDGKKDCSSCLIPHEKGYNYIISKMLELEVDEMTKL